jgi:superfamily II DNA or RNA helicase
MKIIEDLNEIISKVKDSTGRTQRQFIAVKRWAKILFHGTFVACTGFGKTRVGTYALQLLRRSDKNRSVIVVVPTIPLKHQWEKILVDIKQEQNTEVWVINSLAAQGNLQYCDLLILDEIHRYAAITFSRVFNVVKYKYIIGLTATIERSDGKHILLEKHAPVFDEVPLHEARKHGWVAEYEEFAYGINLPEEEQQFYETMYGKQSKLMKYMTVFNYDLQSIIECGQSNKPRWSPETRKWYEPASVRLARSKGWSGNNIIQAVTAMRHNKEAPRKQKISIWGGNKENMFHPDKIVGYAVQARKLIAERKNYICNHELKTEAVEQAYKMLNRKTISFTETKEAARAIQEKIGENAVSYYTNMDSILIKVKKTKEYKRKTSVDKYVEKHPNIVFEIKEKDGKFIISWLKNKWVGETYQKREALRKLKDNRYNIDFISSVKSLNEGIDIPDLELALIHSRNSTARDSIQRTGRVARLFVYKDGRDKKPIIVHIYLKNTKDEDWFKRSTKNAVGIRYIESLDEILQSESFVIVS